MEETIRNYYKSNSEKMILEKALKSVDPNYDTPKKRMCMIEIAKRDGMCCTYCKKPLVFRWLVTKKKRTKMKEWLATYEHYLIPAKDGGPVTVENGALACPSCNVDRGHLPLELFRTRLAGGYYSGIEKAKRAKIKAEKKIDKRFLRMKRKMKIQHAEYCANVLQNQGWRAYAVKYMVLLAHRVKMRNNRTILVSEMFPV